MDLIKIGKYIAGKRKELGLTQKQLAEKLGMSDKSVSKWERGICLPDVSVYMELCEILGISINEFLAGEDISKENFIKKSEDNLIQVSTDSKYKQKNLKSIIYVLIVITIAAVVSPGAILFRSLTQPKNYIMPVARDSTEMKTAELLSGVDGAFLFKYFTKDEFNTLTVYLSEYHEGKLIAKKETASFTYAGIPSASEGMIALVPDFKDLTVKLIVTDDYAKYSSSFPILEHVDSSSDYGRASVRIEEQVPIQYDTEQVLAALIYGKNGVSPVPIESLENTELEAENDYIYYFSIIFGK